jgi:hypothetical protein
MKYERQKQVRELLRETADGLTVKQMHEATGVCTSHLSRMLKKMPDAYIDRWVANDTQRRWYAAVWCVVTPPPDCPRPQGRRKAKP